jgi:hypothetical protein
VPENRLLSINNTNQLFQLREVIAVHSENNKNTYEELLRTKGRDFLMPGWAIHIFTTDLLGR